MTISALIVVEKYTAAEGGRKFSGFEVNLALGFGLYVFFNTPGGVGGWSGDLSGRVLYSGFLSGWSPMAHHVLHGWRQNPENVSQRDFSLNTDHRTL